MNQNDIPMKYVLGLWKNASMYPTKNDVLFEIISFVEKNTKNGEFSEQTLNRIWHDQSGSGNWKETVFEDLFQTLVNDGIITQARTAGDKVWYQIDQEKNPFK